jgi:Imelysin
MLRRMDTNARAHTSRWAAILALVTALAVVAGTGTASAAPASPAQRANLAPTKTYLLSHTVKLHGFTRQFQSQANRYFALAKKADFDHAGLWRTERSAVKRILARSKSLWIEGNPYYERVEGVVAGTPSLAVYDVILDAGSSAKEDPASAVPFDLKLPNGTVLRKPGNLFNLTEGMLWGLLPAYVGAKVDLDGDRKQEFGEVLPRLSDIGDILGGLRVIYSGIRPAIAKVDAAQAAQTKRELDGLHGYVGKLRQQERGGRRFTPQQADVLGKDAQERATAIAGQVAQAAARLKVKIVQ